MFTYVVFNTFTRLSRNILKSINVNVLKHTLKKPYHKCVTLTVHNLECKGFVPLKIVLQDTFRV